MTYGFEQLRLDLEAIASTDAGIRFLRYLYKETDWDSLPSAGSRQTGGLLVENTFYNDGRRSVWKDVGPFLSRNARIRVEYPEEVQKEQQPEQKENEVWPEKINRTPTQRRPKRQS